MRNPEEREPNIYDKEFSEALNKFTKELEEKGLRWVTRNYSISDKEYRVSVSSEVTEKFTDTYGSGNNFEEAFRNAIDNFEKKMTNSKMRDIKKDYISEDKKAIDGSEIGLNLGKFEKNKTNPN